MDAPKNRKFLFFCTFKKKTCKTGRKNLQNWIAHHHFLVLEKKVGFNIFCVQAHCYACIDNLEFLQRGKYKPELRSDNCHF